MSGHYLGWDVGRGQREWSTLGETVDGEGQSQCYQGRDRTSGMDVHSELVHRVGEA